MSADAGGDDIIPARMLNELVYCPRLFYLEHVAGEWDHNVETVQGDRVHRRVDDGPTALPPGDALPDKPLHARSVTVTSVVEGVLAKTDLIEAADGEVVPVDYKRGKVPDTDRVPERVWPGDRVQVGAQALALRENGYKCDRGVVYYAGSKTRVDLPVTDVLIAEVRAAVAEARRVKALPVAPAPLVASPKCPRCSLVGICLPDEVNHLREVEAQAVTTVETMSEAVVDAPEKPVKSIRSLVPSRDDKTALYVQAHGARIGRSGECLEVRQKDGTSTSVRLREVSQVNVLGNVQLTAAALQELCSRGIAVGLFGYGGWYYGTVGNFAEKNVLLRIAQFAAAADDARRLALAREFVAGKIQNGRTLLRRNGGDNAAEAVSALKRHAAKALEAESEETLLGIEGSAARLYFEAYGKLLSPRSGGSIGFDFDGRNRRPPRDPVNALLSLGYALLAKDARIALGMVGFDAMVGFYHRPRHGRPALALDLMEEFRSLIVDSVVLTAVNTEVVREDHFVRAAGSVALRDDGRRAFIGAYERRMDTEVTHPLFGYQVTYRRVLEVQARLLARTVLGEITQYPSFRTR